MLVRGFSSGEGCRLAALSVDRKGVVEATKWHRREQYCAFLEEVIISLVACTRMFLLNGILSRNLGLT